MGAGFNSSGAGGIGESAWNLAACAGHAGPGGRVGACLGKCARVFVSTTRFVALVATVVGLDAAVAEPGSRADWPQFRGPGGSGVSESAKPPVFFGRGTNQLWECAVPSGNSSPCISGEAIYLTGHEDNQLITVCIERSTGRVRWRKTATVEKIEPFYPRLGSAANPTPACDGERVYCYFGSFGVVAYDLEGLELWRRPLPMPMTEFGTATSPVLAGDLLLLNIDQDINSHALALRTWDGAVAWKVDRPGFPRGFGTPTVWRHGAAAEMIVPGAVWLVSYDVMNGRELWRARGQGRVVCTSPVVGDGLLFAASWSPGGDANNRITMPPFDEFAAQNDMNKDGVFVREEIPAGPFGERFSQIDADKDKTITRAEWDLMRDIFARAENSLVAVRPGGRGDVTASHVLWKQTRGLPYVPSPLYYAGRVYLVKNGGLMSCYEARTGRPLYLEERVGALGEYYASPVAADERIYVTSQNGVVVVVAAGDQMRVLARNSLGRPAFASPAVGGDAIYIRAGTSLFSFAQRN